jgi:hypothetical protein
MEYGWGDVGVNEALAHKQKWLAAANCQGVAETITEVEICRVTAAFTKVAVGGARYNGLSLIVPACCRWL